MNGSSNPDYVETLKNKWMTGRGTKILYAAFAFMLFGVLGSAISNGQAESKLNTAVGNSIQLAQIVSANCKDYNFYKSHEQDCLVAQKVIADPTKAATPLVEHKQSDSTSVQP